MLLYVLVPMWLTFLGQRCYLHFGNANADLFVAGYNVHHLFLGALIEISAAMVLVFGVRPDPLRRLAEVALGAGSAMVLDEVVYLITTDGSNAAYLLPISLWGAVVLMGLATAMLLALYRLARRRAGAR